MEEGYDVDLSKEQTEAWDQLDAADRITKRVLYGGQAGGGKSFLICLWQIYRRLEYPGSRGYIAREVLRDLKESVLVTFFDVAKAYGVEYKYADNKNRIDFPNGSRIVLLEVKYKPSDPDFNDLGSTEYTDGAIEEGVNIEKRAAEILLSRTRYKHDEYDLTPKQLITCNPGPGWIKDDIVIPHREGILKPKTAFVPATLDSNPNKRFVSGYRATLEDMDDAYDKARLLHGDWDALPKTGGEFYKEFDETYQVIPAEQVIYNREIPVFLTFDENVNPYLTLLVHQCEGKKLTQIDEICLKHPRNTLKAACKEFEARYANHIGGMFIDGDATSKKEDTKIEKGYNFFDLARQHLAKYKPRIMVPASNPPVSMRGNFINQIFKANFDDLVFQISSNCKETIADYNHLKEDADGTKKKEKFKDPKTKVTYEKWGHCTDANDYLICRLFKDSFTLYLKGPGKPRRKIQLRSNRGSY